jgi:hypothetical protein
MKTEKEVRKQLEKIKNQRLFDGPYSESKSIAWHGTKQALEWVLEETENPLTY